MPKCWKDLALPAYKGEVMLGNPNSSCTAYLMLASLAQIFGEDETFRLLPAIHRNVNRYARSGIGPSGCYGIAQNTLPSKIQPSASISRISLRLVV